MYMKIIRQSFFRDPQTDIQRYYNWVESIEKYTGRKYSKTLINSSLGDTLIWRTGNPESKIKLVIFPGFRTSSLFWDIDKGLDYYLDFDVYLVETNGQPNPSNGSTPAIRSLGYGEWAVDILDKLKLDKPFVAGASFGGQVCMKLSAFAPDRIKAAFLLNPGGLQNISLSWKNIYYNLLPLVRTTRKNIRKFLEGAVFYYPDHQLTNPQMELIIDFEFLALTRYKDNTQKPYYMKEELKLVTSPIYLCEGDKDLLFPSHKSAGNAKKMIPGLKEVIIFKNVGHGIETHRPAHKKVSELILKLL